MEKKISLNDLPEFIGQIIDIFEDFLDEKGIVIENPERDEDPNIDPEESANIYGSDYGALEDEIKELLVNWKIADTSEEPTLDRK
ncbi:MAG: hypothetical protein IJV18_00585 [Acidaminococcaceae bacterium]|nr:hypothetical protein [Acidaminococcaceae bacterium]MBQ8491165.1 hypothetical protein [Acidaminococcaceae bacterium]MBQ9256916.1 hypothetical protein [Acidaminococcaceae bacterium]